MAVYKKKDIFVIEKRGGRCFPPFNRKYFFGEMLEWLKRHAWKACIRQKRIRGSNPRLSAQVKINETKETLITQQYQKINQLKNNTQ